MNHEELMKIIDTISLDELVNDRIDAFASCLENDEALTFSEKYFIEAAIWSFNEIQKKINIVK